MREFAAINEVEVRHLQQRVALGDEKAFRRLFDQFAERLFHFALAFTKTPHSATEVVNEVFIKIWMQREMIENIDHLKTYLYTAVKNTALNYLSRKANEQITEPFDAIDIQLQEEQSPYEQMITTELLKKIQAAVNELPPRCKIVFKLVREDGLKYKEVADILNLSIKTIDAQMVIAVKRISEKVKEHFEHFPKTDKKKWKRL